MIPAVGERVLDWMLRRLRQAVRLDHDLVLVRDSPMLADVGPSIDVRGEPWRVARVTGELTLRDALPDADRLIAIVPSSFPALPMDIAGRTYLRRILDVRAEDLVAAVAARPCEALVDENLVRAVFDSVDTLPSTVGRWSLGELVTAREVRSVLVSAELGTARLDRERDWQLLARWILEGGPTFRAATLVRSALEEAQPRTGAWLAWALTGGSLPQLCTAGALLDSPEGKASAPRIPGLTDANQDQLIELVDAALREVWRHDPSRAGVMVAEAERVARLVPLDAGRHRLLRMPLEGALSRIANRAADGPIPDDTEIESLKRNLYAPELAGCIDLVANLARLARFQRLEIPASDADGVAWFQHALHDVGWADLAYRRARRALETVPPWLADPARRVIAAWLSRRDMLNAAFARSLATHWPSLARNTDLRQPLALHQLSRCVVRRLLDDGQRVLLIVLDGCDLASFLEILETIPPDRRMGLVRPVVSDPVLRDDLDAMGMFGVAISPPPTVTGHARRALFAGEIPGNSALDDTEVAAASATADHRAWDRNTALGEASRQLFLKGDLGATSQPLLDALQAMDPQVLAVVWNGVDDALSSRETTPLAPWSLGALGVGAASIVDAAVDRGWCIVVTADHGHTPFVASDRKVSPSGLGHRCSAEPSDGTVEFRNGPLPRQPLHLLARFGAWFGQQRRGFHGGAGIEEVAVPLAFLGRVRGEQEGRPRAPAWWWSSELMSPPLARVEALRPKPARVETARLEQPRPEAPSIVGAAASVVTSDPQLASLTSEERAVIALLEQNQSVRLSVIAQRLKKPPSRASGFMQQLMRKLFELGRPYFLVEGLPDGDRLYRFQSVDRGNR